MFFQSRGRKHPSSRKYGEKETGDHGKVAGAVRLWHAKVTSGPGLAEKGAALDSFMSL